MRYEEQRIRSEASEQQRRENRYERQRIRSAASEQQQRKKLFDSSSDEEDVQVAQRGSTALMCKMFINNRKS